MSKGVPRFPKDSKISMRLLYLMNTGWLVPWHDFLAFSWTCLEGHFDIAGAIAGVDERHWTQVYTVAWQQNNAAVVWSQVGVWKGGMLPANNTFDQDRAYVVIHHGIWGIIDFPTKPSSQLSLSGPWFCIPSSRDCQSGTCSLSQPGNGELDPGKVWTRSGRV